jgi:hypothetical protein
MDRNSLAIARTVVRYGNSFLAHTSEGTDSGLEESRGVNPTEVRVLDCEQFRCTGNVSEIHAQHSTATAPTLTEGDQPGVFVPPTISPQLASRRVSGAGGWPTRLLCGRTVLLSLGQLHQPPRTLRVFNDTRTCPSIHAAHSCQHVGHHYASSWPPPCCLDEIVPHLPNFSWGEISSLLIVCRGTDGCSFTNSGTQPFRSHSARALHNSSQQGVRRGCTQG